MGYFGRQIPIPATTRAERQGLFERTYYAVIVSGPPRRGSKVT